MDERTLQMLKLKIFIWGEYPGLSRWVQCVAGSLYEREGSRREGLEHRSEDEQEPIAGFEGRGPGSPQQWGQSEKQICLLNLQKEYQPANTWSLSH